MMKGSLTLPHFSHASDIKYFATMDIETYDKTRTGMIFVKASRKAHNGRFSHFQFKSNIKRNKEFFYLFSNFAVDQFLSL